MRDAVKFVRKLSRIVCIISGMICLVLLVYGAILTYRDAIKEEKENETNN